MIKNGILKEPIEGWVDPVGGSLPDRLSQGQYP